LADFANKLTFAVKINDFSKSAIDSLSFAPFMQQKLKLGTVTSFKSRPHLFYGTYLCLFAVEWPAHEVHPTGKLISTWAQVDPNDIIWSQTFLCDQVGDNLIPNIAWQLEV
jgi:hypothetical protein